MRCPNCNSENVNGDKFCRYCGSELTAKVFNDNDKFIQAYVGDNYDNFIRESFNVGAFFFGPAYLLYRKMFLYTFIYFMISLMFSFVIPLVPNIILGFVINGLYLSHANEKVRLIKAENKDLSETELLDTCRDKGGTSFLPVLIYIAIIMAIFVSFVWFVFFILKIGDDMIIEPKPFYETGLEVDYDVPSGFNSLNDNTHDAVSDSHNCRIYSHDNYKGVTSSDEEFIKKYAGNNDLITKSINGDTWYSFIKRGNKNEEIHTYISIKEEKAFFVEYTIFNDSDKYCSNSLETVANSLKLVDKNGVEA